MSKYIVVSDAQYADLERVAEQRAVLPGQVLAELLDSLASDASAPSEPTSPSAHDAQADAADEPVHDA